MLRLHDTAAGAVLPLELREPGRAAIYVCGPTVYDEPHVGHGRFCLVWDILRRYLEWSGLAVRFVSNVTDIDDRIIDRAAEEDRPTTEVTERYEAAWYRCMDALGVRRPDHDPHATAYVDPMVELIADLEAAGVAYPTGHGVYLSVERVDGYGLLARQPLDSLRAGARVEVEEGKRGPLDFVLWKGAKPGEPSWDSPWGRGRPGWHTECVVMALDLLGEDFDLHGGGVDLAFPHHENERAQAAVLGRRFARRWVHSGHVVVGGGEKMSKSLGNVRSLAALLDEVGDPRAYRLLVLQSHYRSPLEVSPHTLGQARRGLAGLDNLSRRAAEAGIAGGAPDPDALARFRSAMDDDLDTPAATGLVFDLARRANAALDAGDREGAAPLVAAIVEVWAAVGLALASGPAQLDEETVALVRRRDQARAARDWSAADSLRDELVGRGLVVEDTPEGTRVHRA
ncbi:MAG: cysteine--tRNA ligase [Acidimicrobiales bacterium]